MLTFCEQIIDLIWPINYYIFIVFIINIIKGGVLVDKEYDKFWESTK